MNGQLRKAINVKAMLRRKFNKCPSNSNWAIYKSQRNFVTRLKKKSLQVYFDEKCNDNKASNQTFWNTVRPYISDKGSGDSHTILKLDDQLVSDQTEVCGAFNDYFINVAVDSSEDSVVQSPLTTVNEAISKYKDHPSIKLINENQYPKSFKFKTVTSSQILSTMRKINPKKACGYDEIPGKLIKHGAEVLSTSLTPIFNNCIRISVFPDSFKKAEVRPIHKKDDIMSIKNYRPVSILSSYSKVVEGLLCEQIISYFDNILSPMLCAYRKRYSCSNLLIKCTENWKHSLDNNEFVGCILMDLSKAFDVIPHDLLVAKLSAYGFTTEACDLVYSYLVGRNQRVKLGNARSDWLCMKKGVPQGSLTGPLLFNIFLNDLLICLNDKCTVYNYADDNSLSYSHADPQVLKRSLEDASNLAITWFNVNKMRVNPAKFQAIVLDPRYNGDVNLDFKLADGTIIQASNHVKLLGVKIDKNLNFSSHIKDLTAKCARQTNVIARLFKLLNKDCKMKIFNSFIMSNLNYCATLYHFCRMEDAVKLERIQKRALRYVFNDFDLSYEELLNACNRQTLHVQRLRTILECVFKIRHNLLPPMEPSFFLQSHHGYELRRSNTLRRPKPRTTYYGINSLQHLGSRCWNEIPENMRHAETFKDFKNMLSNWSSV